MNMNNSDVDAISQKYLQIIREANTRPDYNANRMAKGEIGFKGSNIGIATGSKGEQDRKDAGKSHYSTAETIEWSSFEYEDKVQAAYQSGLYLDFDGKLTEKLKTINDSIKQYNKKTTGDKISLIPVSKYKNIKLDFSDFQRANDFNMLNKLLTNKRVVFLDPSDFSSSSFVNLPLILDSLNALKIDALLPQFLSLVEFIANPKVWDLIYSKSNIKLNALDGRSIVVEMTDPKIKKYFINRLKYIKDSGEYFSVTSERDQQNLSGEFDITLGTKIIPYFIGKKDTKVVTKTGERRVAYTNKQNEGEIEAGSKRSEITGNNQPNKALNPSVTGDKSVSSRANARPSETAAQLTQNVKDIQRQIDQLKTQLSTATGADRFRIAQKLGQLKSKLSA